MALGDDPRLIVAISRQSCFVARRPKGPIDGYRRSGARQIARVVGLLVGEAPFVFSHQELFLRLFTAAQILLVFSSPPFVLHGLAMEGRLMALFVVTVVCKKSRSDLRSLERHLRDSQALLLLMDFPASVTARLQAWDLACASHFFPCFGTGVTVLGVCVWVVPSCGCGVVLLYSGWYAY